MYPKEIEDVMTRREAEKEKLYLTVHQMQMYEAT
jgi:hypothetical protein